jgi:hypothetical protein
MHQGGAHQAAAEGLNDHCERRAVTASQSPHVGGLDGEPRRVSKSQ